MILSWIKKLNENEETDIFCKYAKNGIIWGDYNQIGNHKCILSDISGLAKIFEFDIINKDYNCSWEKFYQIFNENDKLFQSNLENLGIKFLPDLNCRLYSDGYLINYDLKSGQNNISLSDLDINFVSFKAYNYILPSNITKILKLIKKQRETQDNNLIKEFFGQIRKIALESNLTISDYIKNTIIVTPENLNLKHTEQSNERYEIKIDIDFQDCPANFMQNFDKYPNVEKKYVIGENSKLTEVIISDSVQPILRKIKQYPKRILKDNDAIKFIENPKAFLDDNENIINENNENFTRKMPNLFEIEYNSLNKKLYININHNQEIIEFNDNDEIKKFQSLLSGANNKNIHFVEWHNYKLYFGENFEKHNTRINEYLSQINSDEFLKGLSDRIYGIGQQKKEFSPYISLLQEKKGWLPENIVKHFSVINNLTGEIEQVKCDDKAIEQIENSVNKAQENQQQIHVKINNNDYVIPIQDAKTMTEVFNQSVDKLKKSFEKNKTPKNELLFYQQIIAEDYIKNRNVALMNNDMPIRLPDNRKAYTELKDHQIDGVRFLQHLYSCAPKDCKGALLADDMGLGKTLQTLIFIFELLESQKANKILIVAPVSLLENWQNEIDKFFNFSNDKILQLYDKNITHIKNKFSLDINNLKQKTLKNDWHDGFDIVLTTYETMRDYEYSLAKINWSVIICDEAQKIKNPSSGFTKSIKKLKYKFAIACTGTPIENHLAELWSIFDFIQPGLLGSLNSFGKKYKSPIERKTDQEEKAIEELQKIIEPQFLRRMKEDVANLPKKVIDFECQDLKISDKQHNLIVKVANQISPERMLEFLHYYKKICAFPFEFSSSLIENNIHNDDWLKDSPKLKWLLEKLSTIKSKQEKVIIFTSEKDIQLRLHTAITKKFSDLEINIVNGDTPVQDEIHSRQKKIDDFQNKHGFNVIILSPLSCGAGFNIQKANHVVHFTRHWNPAKEDQATDRAYRIGQDKEVFVYYPQIKSQYFDTFDKKLNDLLNAKRELATNIYNGYGGSISEQDFLRGINDLLPKEVNEINWQNIDEQFLKSINSKAFVKLIKIIIEKQNPKNLTELRDGAGDEGIDIISFNNQNLEIICVQCKSTTSQNKLSYDSIREVFYGADNYKKSHPEYKLKLICATNFEFNQNAINEAQNKDVELWDFDILKELIKKHKVKEYELF